MRQDLDTREFHGRQRSNLHPGEKPEGQGFDMHVDSYQVQDEAHAFQVHRSSPQEDKDFPEEVLQQEGRDNYLFLIFLSFLFLYI